MTQGAPSPGAPSGVRPSSWLTDHNDYVLLIHLYCGAELNWLDLDGIVAAGCSDSG
jgi:hypothetical protein